MKWNLIFVEQNLANEPLTPSAWPSLRDGWVDTQAYENMAGLLE